MRQGKIVVKKEVFMTGFYVDYEFEDKYSKTKYFLPLCFNTNDKNKAEKMWLAMKTALNTKYKINITTKPIPIIKDINEESIRQKMQKPWKGKAIILKVKSWTFTEFKPDLELSFDENLGLATIDKVNNLFDPTGLVATSIKEYKYPIQVVSDPFPDSSHEYLAVVIIQV